jgi:hypothetical protein
MESALVIKGSDEVSFHVGGIQSLQSIHLFDCPNLKAVHGLAENPTISSNAFKRCAISDFQFLEDETRVVDVTVGDCPLQGLDGLERLPKLTDLHLDKVPISNARFDGLATGLERLGLRRTMLSDVAGIDRFTSLERLDLSRSRIRDLLDAGQLRTLLSLRMEASHLESLTGAEGLENLRELHLRQSRSNDYGSLQSLTALEQLDLSKTNFSDPQLLLGLHQLKELSLTNTQVKDILSLSKLRSLQELHIRPVDLDPDGLQQFLRLRPDVKVWESG